LLGGELACKRLDHRSSLAPSSSCLMTPTRSALAGALRCSPAHQRPARQVRVPAAHALNLHHALLRRRRCVGR
jgi:hypothetical protein